jgi:hypothetical protein
MLLFVVSLRFYAFLMGQKTICPRTKTVHWGGHCQNPDYLTTIFFTADRQCLQGV